MVKLIVFVLVAVSLVMGCADYSNTDAPSDKAELEPGNKSASKADFEFHNISGGSLEQTEEILHNSLVGHLIVNGDYPYSVPVNYIYEGSAIHFPLRKDADRKIFDILAKDSRVCFAVDNYDSDRWHSIHVFGEATVSDFTREHLEKYVKAFGEAGFAYDKDVGNLVFVQLKPELVTVRLNYGIPYWYLGKLNPAKDGKLSPRFGLVAGEKHGFADGVKFAQGTSPEYADYILRVSHSGRINTLGKDSPYSVPLNCGYVNGKIVIHSKKNGLKVLNISNNQSVTFDVEWCWNGADWVSVTIDGKAKLLPAEEGIEAMQYFSEFLASADGRIPADYKPEPGKNIGSDRMMGRLAVLEVTPELVTVRSAKITKEWYPKMPDAFMPK